MILLNSKFTIKNILADHWSSFLDLGFKLRPAIIKNVEKVIHCGNLSNGYALYSCDSCGHVKYVPFRCKSRFCNTCGSNYVNQRAQNITAKLIKCQHRHIVFTIPAELRNLFRINRLLLHHLFQAASSTLLSWFRKQNKSESYTPGIIATLHTFGRDLKWNPHIHIIVTEGAAGNFTVWKPFKNIPFVMLRKKWQTTLLSLLHSKLGHSFYSLKTTLFHTYSKGFYVYARTDENSKHYDCVKYVVRYTGKPALAQSRILNYDGVNVTFYYDRHEDNKRIINTHSAIDFIKLLIVHIPDEQFKMVRYYGLYAKKHRHHKKLRYRISSMQKEFFNRHRFWRHRILLAFGYDPLKCTCGSTLTLLDIIIRKPTSLAPSLLNFYNSG